MNQLQASLQRSLTIDVSGLRSGFWQAQALQPAHEEALPHCHSAPIAEARQALGEEHAQQQQLYQQAEGEPTEPQCRNPLGPASPFCSAAMQVSNALNLLAAERKAGSSEQNGHAACSEPVAGQTPREADIFSASCSFPPYFPSLGSCISSQYEASVQLPGCPAHGVKAVCGKRAKMEDAYQVLPFFFDLPGAGPEVHAENKLPARIALQLEVHSAAVSSVCSTWTGPVDQVIPCETDTLHFFGVYDGHGGCEAAQHCANRLHHHLSTALSQACQPQPGSAAGAVPSSTDVGTAVEAACSDCSTSQPQADSLKAQCNSQVSPHAAEEVNLSEGSSRASEEAICCTPQSVDKVSTLLQSALQDAFLRTDAEFGLDSCAAMVGSTAVVALIGKHKMWIANCGDSRAVLCRSGKVIQLTDDHKPEREDEAARVERAGGQVLYWNGHRVMGVLAMSRAIGDHGLRPYVIPEPEITVLTRCDDDDFLLLASDGLWDVMANQEATNLAIRCMHRAWEKGASRKAAVRIAASVLTKAAIDRGSKDNVTVVIVDLRSGPPPTAKVETVQSDHAEANPAPDSVSNSGMGSAEPQSQPHKSSSPFLSQLSPAANPEESAPSGSSSMQGPRDHKQPTPASTPAPSTQPGPFQQAANASSMVLGDDATSPHLSRARPVSLSPFGQQ